MNVKDVKHILLVIVLGIDYDFASHYVPALLVDANGLVLDSTELSITDLFDVARVIWPYVIVCCLNGPAISFLD